MRYTYIEIDVKKQHYSIIVDFSTYIYFIFKFFNEHIKKNINILLPALF